MPDSLVAFAINDLTDCSVCLSPSSCYLIEEPFEVSDFEEFTAIQNDLNTLLPPKTLTEIKLAAENKDLRASIVELKEWCEENTKSVTNCIESQKGTRTVVYMKEVAVRRELLEQLVEHCEAALEQQT